MAEHVKELWDRIEKNVPDQNSQQRINNRLETVANGFTPEGTSVFYKVKDIIDEELSKYKTVDKVVSVIYKGPWNMMGFRRIMNKLIDLNEYTNTVHYLLAQGIQKLGQMGEEGKKELQKMCAENRFDGLFYSVNGGNSPT